MSAGGLTKQRAISRTPASQCSTGLSRLRARPRRRRRSGEDCSARWVITKVPARRCAMFTRRSFLRGATGLAVASFNEKGLAHALDATRFVANRTPEDVARDEDFWFQIQRAFTVDRTYINLNNGGVSPSPLVVQDAM